MPWPSREESALHRNCTADTEKDRARMAGEPLLAALAAKTHVLPVTLAVIEADELRALVLAKMRR